MKINLKIAIMSHLSDAQELVSLGCDPTQEINIAKRIILGFDDLSQSVEEDEINRILKNDHHE